MRIHATEIRLMPIDDLIQNPENPNKHTDEQIDNIARVISGNGFRRPVTVSNQSGMVVVGHGRLLAAKKLGMKEIPVIYQDYESYDFEYADMVADNALNNQSKLDLSMINAKLPDIGPIDLTLFGVKDLKVDPSEKKPKKEIKCPSCGFAIS